MKIVAISDTHAMHNGLRLPTGDVLLHSGDITHKGSKSETLDFIAWFGKQEFSSKIFIGGNHDFYLEKMKPQELASTLPSGVIYLNDSGITIGNINIWGSPVTPWFYNWAFNRQRGKAIRKHWDKIPSGTHILMTHGPGYGFLDQLFSEEHVGCQDLLRKVLTLQPAYHVFGHIHESYGILKRSGITFINASLANEQYRLANRPIVFEI